VHLAELSAEMRAACKGGMGLLYLWLISYLTKPELLNRRNLLARRADSMIVGIVASFNRSDGY
jgi:hypothetical protein